MRFIFGFVVFLLGTVGTTLVIIPDLYWIAQYGLDGSALFYIVQVGERLAAANGSEPSTLMALGLWLTPLWLMIVGLISMSMEDPLGYPRRS